MGIIGGIGVPELVIILLVVLVIFGPKNLPKLGASLGKTVKNIRAGMSEDEKEDKKKIEDVEVVEAFRRQEGRRGRRVRIHSFYVLYPQRAPLPGTCVALVKRRLEEKRPQPTCRFRRVPSPFASGRLPRRPLPRERLLFLYPQHGTNQSRSRNTWVQPRRLF